VGAFRGVVLGVVFNVNHLSLKYFSGSSHLLAHGHKIPGNWKSVVTE